jgi:putative FmdB family regulatory protein
MPLFDFRCRSCGHQFEALVRAQDPPPSACPKCQAADLERLLSAVAVTSREKVQAAADKKRHKEAAVGRNETAAEQREIEHHRREDH